MKQKILVILDHSYKSQRKYEQFKDEIMKLYGNNYEIVFKLFDPVQARYDYIPENIQSVIDSDTVMTYTDNYVCVIVDGPAAYFWLQSFYDGNLIAINPVIDIYSEIQFNQSVNETLKLTRSFQTNNVICILSDEFKDRVEEYDNVFYDTTVVLAKENIKDISSFWSKKSSFDQVFRYMVDIN